MEIKLNGDTVYTLQFANHRLIIAQSKDDLIHIIEAWMKNIVNGN